MRVRRRMVCMVGIAAIAALGTHAWAATCQLELKRLDSSTGRSGVSRPRDAVFGSVSSQYFFHQTGNVHVLSPSRGTTPNFSVVIYKEPTRYNCKDPFRAVAKLGDQYFGFVLDTSSSSSTAQTSAGGARRITGSLSRFLPGQSLPRYSRLYFDRNHNGDLTDDTAIEAEQRATSVGTSYVYYSFPRVDLKVRAGGVTTDYAFRLSGYARLGSGYQYAYALLAAAAYRQGEIVLDGKKRRVVLVDYNSNGRFDDRFAVNDQTQLSDGRVLTTAGDMIYIDPDLEHNAFSYGFDPTRSDEQHYLTKQINIDRRLYEIQIAPAGNTLTLKPTAGSVGYVSNPNRRCRAVLFGKQGVIEVALDASHQAPVPVGEWKLLSYTIDRTDIPKEEPEQPQEANSLADLLTQAVAVTDSTESSTRPGRTLISATGTQDSPSVVVAEGQTVPLPFGPPYTPVVKADYPERSGQVSLSMALIGSGRERCTSLSVDGHQPHNPTFTISDPAGKVVKSGAFGFG